MSNLVRNFLRIVCRWEGEEFGSDGSEEDERKGRKRVKGERTLTRDEMKYKLDKKKLRALGENRKLAYYERCDSNVMALGDSD